MASRGRVLNGELYGQRLQKLIYLNLFTDCFMKISDEWGEMFMKQHVNKFKEINFCNLCVTVH